MSGRNVAIYFSEATYNKLRQVVGTKLSRFVSEAVEEKLKKKEQNQKEQLRQQLIKDYQSQSKNKKLQKELRAMEATQFEDLKNKDE